MNKIIISMLFLMLPMVVRAQNGKIKEGATPQVQVYLVQGDSASRITYLKKDQDNRIRVIISGGIEQVKNIVIVTSKDAVVNPDPLIKNEFIVRPGTDNFCEIIVDLKTFESYHQVKMIETPGGKKMKQLVKKYPPKTYMLGYEKYKVK